MSKTLVQELLGDTGDIASWAEDNLSPEELAQLAEEPASVLWVVRFVRRVHLGCWVARWVRNFRLWLAIGLGIGIGASIAINLIGWISVRSMVRESQRATVIQTLKEVRLLSEGPIPAAGESVASLLGGSK